MAKWTFADIPDLTGRTAIVTGANTGIGFETARMLVQKGATVIVACRDPNRGKAAVDRLMASKPSGNVEFAQLDLADLESVAAFAKNFQASHSKLDLLINNAGVMATPFGHTKQGFEQQVGINHLGHFALTGRLLPTLEATPDSRIIVLSSLMHHFSGLQLDDLNWSRRTYDPQAAYNASKLANLLFVAELQRRLQAAGSKVRVIGAHPGVTRSELTRSMNRVVQVVNSWFASVTEEGALPTLRAATDPAAESGSYWGPSGIFGNRGAPDRAAISKRAQDNALAQQLFVESEKLTGVQFAR